MKKVMALALSLFLVTGMFSFGFSAASGDAVVDATYNAANAGETVTLTVKLSSTKISLTGFDFIVKYDTAKLEVKNTEKEIRNTVEFAHGNGSDATLSYGNKADQIKVLAADVDKMQSTACTMFIISFTALDNVDEGAITLFQTMLVDEANEEVSADSMTVNWSYTKANTDVLNETIKTAQALTPAEYTAESFAKVTSALNRAVLLKDSVNPSKQSEIDVATKLLQTAIFLLLHDNVVVVDASYNRAKAGETVTLTVKLDSTKIDLSGFDFIVKYDTAKLEVKSTEKEIRNTVEFSNMITGATLNYYNNANQIKVLSAATNNLQNTACTMFVINFTAIADINEGDITFIQTLFVDEAAKMLSDNDMTISLKYITMAATSALEAAIEEAEAVDASIYTSLSYAALSTALAEAKAMLCVTIDKQPAVNEACKKLTDAINALVIRYAIGDVDGNGNIELSDAIKTFQYVAGKGTLSASSLAAADVDNNLVIELSDAVKIFQYVAGKVTSF